MPLTRGYTAPGSGTGAGASTRIFNQVLSGSRPGTVFTTPSDFVAGSEAVHYNGVRQFEGAGDDYVRSESGGVGTGFDTITFAFTVLSEDNLLVDYTPA